MIEMKNRILLVLVLAAAFQAVVPPAAAQTFCVPPSRPPQPPPPDNPPTVCEPHECSCCSRSPCYVGQGTYVNEFFDLAVKTASFPLQAGRRYVSSRLVDGPVGVGWTSSLTPRLYYATYLFTAPATYSYEAHVMLPDGVVYKYTSTGGSNFTPPGGRTDQLVRNGDGSWDLTVGSATVVLHFDNTGAAETLTDENGNQIGYVYDQQGKLQKIEDRSGSGRYLELVWGGDGRIASVTARTASPTSPTKTVQYTYNSDGALATVTDPAGHATTYTYTTGRFAPLLQSVRDHWNRQLTSLTFDSLERLTGYTDGDPAWGGESFTYAYFSGLTMKTSSTGSESYYYTTNGFPSNIAITRDTGTGRVLSDSRTGYPKNYTYDAQGRLTVEQVFTGSTWVWFKYSYDATWPDRLSAIEAYNNSALTLRNLDYQASYYIYYGPAETGKGQLKRIELLRTDGTTRDVVARYEYDTLGRLTSEEEVGTGPARTYAYNAAGDLVSDTYNNASIVFGYDALGRQTSVTDRMGAVTSYEFDALDRVTAVTFPAPSPTAPLFRSTVSYDNFNSAKNLLFTDKTDVNGFLTRSGYDVMGNLVEHLDPLGNLTKYTRTSNLLTKITDANGNDTTYTYDVQRRPVRTTWPDGSYEEVTYGNNDEVASKRNRAGTVFTYSYDAFDRLWQTSWNNGQRLVQYLHTGQKLTDIKSYNGTAWDTTSYTWDPQYRVLTETQNNRGKLTFAYVSGNPSDRLSSVTVESAAGVPGAPMVTQFTNYDAAGRVTQIYWDGGYYSLTYNANDQYTSISDPWGHTRELQYDGQGRLTSVVNKRSSSILASFTYGYDYNWTTGANTMLGQRTSVNVTALSGLSQNAGLTKYFYDARYQLTRTEYGSQVGTWTYDAIGNRLTDSATGTTYAYYPNSLGNNTDRLKSINGSSQLMQYDSRGNLVTDGSTNLEYVWDDENRLLKRKIAGTSNVVGTWFEYDALSRRATRESGYEKYAVLHFGMHAVSERRMTSQLGRTDPVDYLFAPGIDLPIAVKTQDGTAFYLADGLGSVIGKDGTDYQISEGTGYSPFGQPTADWPSYFGYTGRESVDGTLWYYRARYYNSHQGRFLSDDPARTYYRNMVGRSGYAYAENSPIDNTDPTGLRCEGGQSCRTGIIDGPWIRRSTDWRQAWFLRDSVRPGPQAGTNNGPPRINRNVPANQSPRGGIPIPIQNCYWEKMNELTDHFARDVSMYRACQCPSSYTILAAWTEYRMSVTRYGFIDRQVFRTVGYWIFGLPPRPCPNPAELGM